ncbi:27_t:CDS:2 [Paraglomus brasilianum]|uniref:27_t:CDS:1 n=1 Tax=Paraglomus brasilianum TaxID=144538 RepID=A0A9N8ZK38_9GLOM|nr:27_t:CDS:2 [Paraglomus brasilianum]
MTKSNIFVLEADRPTALSTIRALYSTGSHHSNRHMDVTALVTERASKEALAALRGLSCKIVTITDPRNVSFEGCTKLYIVASPERLDFLIPYIEAAKKASVQFVLLQSVIIADGRGEQGKKHLYAENKLTELFGKKACLPLEENAKARSPKEHKKLHHHAWWCILRVGVYSHYLFAFKDGIKRGVLELPIGDGKFAPVSIEDIGCVSANILDKSENYYSHVYTVTGSELFSGKLLASRLSAILKHEVKYVPSEMAYVEEKCLKKYIPNDVIRTNVITLFELIKKGRLEYVSPHFTEIDGITPRTLEQFILDYKKEFSA